MIIPNINLEHCGMRFLKKSIVLLGILAMSYNANAGLMSIEIDDQGGLSASQFSIFSSAKSAWEDLLFGVQSDSDLFISIAAKGLNIDGVGGVLGRAGPTTVLIDRNVGFAYATSGLMEFDSADLASLESKGVLFDVLFHELAHAIGYGTLWNTGSLGGVFSGTQNVYNKDSGQYTGAYGLAAYRYEFDPTALYVPVELDGGEGTANGHWDESWLGGSGEIMTGYLGSSSFLSMTTVASFADIGYLTSVTHSRITEVAREVPVPATLGLFLIGLMFLRRK